MTSKTLLLAALLLSFSRPPFAVAEEKPTSLSDARAAIEANLRTPQGKAYDEQLGKEFMQKHTNTIRQCKQSVGNDLASFWILLKLDKGGAVKEVLLSPATKLANCARETLLKSRFSPPPQPDYWVGIYMQFRR